MTEPGTPPDTSPTGRRGHTGRYLQWRQIAEEIAAEPGQWMKAPALLFERKGQAEMFAYRVRHGKAAAFRDVGTFEATWAPLEDSTGFQVYLRCTSK